MPEESSQLCRDEAYEEFAMVYQERLAALLNEVLESRDITDADARRDICSDFLFQMGILHDQQSLPTSDGTVHPLLCFSEQFLDVDTDMMEFGRVYAPSPSFSFLEYSGGAVDRALGKPTTSRRGLSFPSFEEQRQDVQRWLDRPVSIADARQYCQDRDDRGDSCRAPGSWMGLLKAELLSKSEADDALWWYKADADAWANHRGKMGIALVRDGDVVAFMETGRS